MNRLLLALAASLFACVAHAATLLASPTDLSALTKSVAGDTISFGPGAYGDVILDKRAGLTLAPADATRPPVLRSLLISAGSNVSASGLQIEFTPDAKTTDGTPAVRIVGSTGITLKGLSVHGGAAVAVPAGSSNIIGLPTGRGVSVEQSTGVTLDGLEVWNFHRGVFLNQSGKVAIRNNNLHDMRTTAIVGAEVTDLTIDNNWLHDAHPANWGLPGGDHADFLALWSNPTQTTPNARVSVTSNLMEQADGKSILGMWFQGQPASPFTDFTISDNRFYLANLQGISLWYAQGGTIARNVMARQPLGVDVKQAPAILIRDGSKAIVLTDNTVSQISDTSGGGNVQTGTKLTTALAPLAGSWSLAVKAPPVPTVDPRDAQIADLTAKLKAANDNLAAANATVSTLQAQAVTSDMALKTAQDAQKATQTALDGAQAALAAKNAALAAIQSQAATALAK